MNIQAHPCFPPTPSILMMAAARRPEKAPGSRVARSENNRFGTQDRDIPAREVDTKNIEMLPRSAISTCVEADDPDVPQLQLLSGVERSKIEGQTGQQTTWCAISTTRMV